MILPSFTPLYSQGAGLATNHPETALAVHHLRSESDDAQISSHNHGLARPVSRSARRTRAGGRSGGRGGADPGDGAGNGASLVLRPAGSDNGNVWAAAPVIYANGAPIGDIPAGTDFYRDLRPGTYSFTVQPYGLPNGQADTVQLAPGTQTYLKSSGWPAGRRAIRRQVGGSPRIPSVS